MTAQKCNKYNFIHSHLFFKLLVRYVLLKMGLVCLATYFQQHWKDHHFEGSTVSFTTSDQQQLGLQQGVSFSRTNSQFPTLLNPSQNINEKLAKNPNHSTVEKLIFCFGGWPKMSSFDPRSPSLFQLVGRRVIFVGIANDRTSLIFLRVPCCFLQLLTTTQAWSMRRTLSFPDSWGPSCSSLKLLKLSIARFFGSFVDSDRA